MAIIMKTRYFSQAYAYAYIRPVFTGHISAVLLPFMPMSFVKTRLKQI